MGFIEVAESRPGVLPVPLCMATLICFVVLGRAPVRLYGTCCLWLPVRCTDLAGAVWFAARNLEGTRWALGMLGCEDRGLQPPLLRTRNSIHACSANVLHTRRCALAVWIAETWTAVPQGIVLLWEAVLCHGFPCFGAHLLRTFTSTRL